MKKTPVEGLIDSILGLDYTNIDDLKTYLEYKRKEFLLEEREVIINAHNDIDTSDSDDYYEEQFGTI